MAEKRVRAEYIDGVGREEQLLFAETGEPFKDRRRTPGKTEREICYLTVHSVLHLLGYDHIDEGEMKKQMRAREKEIMGDT